MRLVEDRMLEGRKAEDRRQAISLCGMARCRYTWSLFTGLAATLKSLSVLAGLTAALRAVDLEPLTHLDINLMLLQRSFENVQIL
jgi:hypothetical protein